MILFEQNLKIGDVVELDSGVRGHVKEINVRSTLISTNDGVDIVVPNSEFISGKVTNYTLREPYHRIHVPFGVAYGSDKDEVRRVVSRMRPTRSVHPPRSGPGTRRLAGQVRRQQPRFRAGGLDQPGGRLPAGRREGRLPLGNRDGADAGTASRSRSRSATSACASRPAIWPASPAAARRSSPETGRPATTQAIVDLVRRARRAPPGFHSDRRCALPRSCGPRRRRGSARCAASRAPRRQSSRATPPDRRGRRTRSGDARRP